MRSGSEKVKTSFYQSLKLFHFWHMGIPLQEEHRVPIRHCPIDLIVFVRQDSVAFSKSKWFFALCNTVVINWLNKQMNDQMMSQQRLGPFEMHTKPVSTRGPPLVPYNKVCQIIQFAFFFFFLIIISSIIFNLIVIVFIIIIIIIVIAYYHYRHRYHHHNY